jgi:DNA-binding response OmpR family regulator
MEVVLMSNRILVVEDDPGALRLVTYTLETEGYEVLTATNGLQGLRKAQNDKPDLVILDVMLPGIDGFEICHRLRAEPATAKLLIMMLSAKAREADKTTGLKMGADDYLPKPADPADIVSHVKALLAKKVASPG